MFRCYSHQKGEVSPVPRSLFETRQQYNVRCHAVFGLYLVNDKQGSQLYLHHSVVGAKAAISLCEWSEGFVY